jgi:hypothetical protein
VYIILAICYNQIMALIGMPAVAIKMGISFRSAKRALKNADVPLVVINARALAVEDTELASFLAKRPANYSGRGRPQGARNKPKDESRQQMLDEREHM